MSVIHFLSSREQTDVQSIQNNNSLHQKIADSPQSEENTDSQIDLHRPQQMSSRLLKERNSSHNGEDNEKEVEPARMPDECAIW